MQFELAQPLYKQAYDRIKHLILTGELTPGSKVIVSKLAKEYQVSRTPLREALRQLQKEGLLIQNHLGTRVVSINLTDYEELYFCRLLLEKQVMSMVVAEISDESLEKAADILVQARNALKNENYLDILTLNTQFHEVFYHTCSNRRLVQMLENIRSLLLIYRANALKYLDYNREVTEEHGKILEAVQERDVNKAIEAVGTHVTNDMNRGRIIFTKKENSAESN